MSWCVIELPGLKRVLNKRAFLESWGAQHFKTFKIDEISDEDRVYLKNAVPKKPVPGLASASVYPEDLTNVPERVLKKISFYFFTQ